MYIAYHSWLHTNCSVSTFSVNIDFVHKTLWRYTIPSEKATNTLRADFIQEKPCLMIHFVNSMTSDTLDSIVIKNVLKVE